MKRKKKAQFLETRLPCDEEVHAFRKAQKRCWEIEIFYGNHPLTSFDLAMDDKNYKAILAFLKKVKENTPKG